MCREAQTPQRLTALCTNPVHAHRVRCLTLPRRPAPPCSEARVEVKRAAHEAARAHELAAGLENQLQMAVRQVAALQARSKVRLMCVAVCG